MEMIRSRFPWLLSGFHWHPPHYSSWFRDAQLSDSHRLGYSMYYLWGKKAASGKSLSKLNYYSLLFVPC